jgi:UDPglucose 6-dehydrogenase
MAAKKGAVRIGFIGQGYVGKNYADDFERRGFPVVRYSLEEAYVKNRDLIKHCDVVFIAVPTPTTSKGFDASIVEQALKLVGPGKIAVIKSTILPGTSAKLQKKFPKIALLFSPEFLSEATASYDVANPFANIVGITRKTAKHQRAAAVVHSILPKSPFTHTSSSTEAELIKYAHNVSGYMQILTFNLMYDLAEKLGSDWDAIQPAIYADPMIPNYYSNPIHKRGRGAGGNCFIKDFAAYATLYRALVKRPEGMALLNAAERHNIALLTETEKDLHLLEKVYGSKTSKKR